LESWEFVGETLALALALVGLRSCQPGPNQKFPQKGNLAPFNGKEGFLINQSQSWVNGRTFPQIGF